GVPVTAAADPESALGELVGLIRATGAQRVLDLSDEPVLGYTQRCRMASVALWAGATYVGADFSFTPPDRSLRPAAPSVAVIGTGKRTGKTAIAGMAARIWREAGLRPVIVAMGRGGPPEPEVIDAGTELDAGILLGFFGLYRLLLADLVVRTMCEESLDRGQLAAVERCARSRPLSHPKVVCTVFRPHPLADVTGKRIWFGTTAVERAGPALKQHLEGTYGCDVVAVSHALARRDALRRDL